MNYTQFAGKAMLSQPMAGKTDEEIIGDVSNYKYTLNFNPKMWIPVNIDTIE